jgi:flagellar hook-length control protein FliK
VEAPAEAGEAAAPAEAMARVVDHARFLRRGESQEIEILLRPESLGRLRVRVASDGRGVSVRILAEEASAAESLAANGAHLKADLDAAGIDLADFEISVSADDEDFRSPDCPEAVLRRHGPSAPAGRGLPDRGRIDYFA